MPVDRTPRAVPSLTIAQMIEVDRIMVEDFGITLVQMMENAGRNLARLAAVHLSGGGCLRAFRNRSGGRGQAIRQLGCNRDRLTRVHTTTPNISSFTDVKNLDRASCAGRRRR